MKVFSIEAQTTNKKSLKKFLKFFEKELGKKQKNTLKRNRLIKNKKIVTILKSPHVNKIAQEQFEKREFSIKMLLVSEDFNKTIVTIKKVLKKIFHDIRLTIKHLTNSKFNKINTLNIFKNTNFKLCCKNKVNKNKNLLKNKNIKKLYSKINFNNLKTYSNLLNNYGEITIKKLLSSE